MDGETTYSEEGRTATGDQARLCIDLNALAANFHMLRSLTPRAETAPVVKANGYGLGAGPVARRLWAEGAQTFFVARVSEGVALRTALGPDRSATIYILDGCPAGAAATLLASDLIPVLNSFTQIDDWALHAVSTRRRLSAALHVDTGMNRLGLRPEEARALAFAPDRLRPLELELVISHLACAATPEHPLNAAQAERFAQVAALFPGVRRSLSSSAGIFLGEGYGLDMTRPGISLYGGAPTEAPELRLTPVVTLEAPILQVRNVPAGETIGYGAAFQATHAMRIAVIGAGYADGVLRSASPASYAKLGGARRPFLGRISMDLIALDVSDCSEAQPGAFVELIGAHISVDDAARAAGTAAYEVLTRIGARARLTYVGEVV
jgi:alanine racemase